MARRRSWLLLALLFACSAPEDENKSPRCATQDDCDSDRMCYRTFCIPSDRVAAEDPSFGAATDASGAWSADAAVPSADAAATPVITTPAADAPVVSGSASQETVVGQQDAVTTNASPNTHASVPSPNPSSSAADAGATTVPAAGAPPNGAAQAPAKDPAKPGTRDMPVAEEAPNAAQAMIIQLIETGLAPVTLIFCAGSCTLGLDDKECQKCFERVLGKDAEKAVCVHQDDDDDERENRGKEPAACAFVCKERSCESDS